MRFILILSLLALSLAAVVQVTNKLTSEQINILRAA